MKAVNLYTYTRIQEDTATEFDNILSARLRKIQVKPQEFRGIKILVEKLIRIGAEVSLFEDFFMSYTIDQIGKEFDLLKIDRGNLVLNIELKSQQIEEEDILKQLNLNRYYLKHLAGDVRLYTFVDSNERLYKYVDGSLKEARLDELFSDMKLFTESVSDDIESLFRPKDYLIAPLSTPDKFLTGEYFLTIQQQEFKKSILLDLTSETNIQMIGIAGSTGTGKTLLLYDIANQLARDGKRCIVLYRGGISEGQVELNELWENVTLCSLSEFVSEQNAAEDLSSYFCCFVDEAHGIGESEANHLMQLVNIAEVHTVFSYDNDLTSQITMGKNIVGYLNDQSGFTEYTLSNRIRISREIDSFTESLMNLRHSVFCYMDYSNIDILYANTTEEENVFTKLYSDLGYAIGYPDMSEDDTLKGQEADRILVILDQRFYYDASKRLSSEPLNRHVYEIVSKAREKLCVLVVGNYPLFCQILNIKYDMLEKYQYRDNSAGLTLTTKKLNRLTKKVKDLLSEAKEVDTTLISETIDMINDELSSMDPRKKVIRNGVRFLNILESECNEKGYYNLGDMIREFCKETEEVSL